MVLESPEKCTQKGSGKSRKTTFSVLYAPCDLCLSQENTHVWNKWRWRVKAEGGSRLTQVYLDELPLNWCACKYVCVSVTYVETTRHLNWGCFYMPFYCTPSDAVTKFPCSDVKFVDTVGWLGVRQGIWP